ncbi:MAG: sensor histidine kinase, partial [Spirochaetia bacterium]|nr:sensor histidine kinase [Spirochaetia bacterium]
MQTQGQAPAQSAKIEGIIISPAVWNGQIVNGQTLTGVGFGTYRLRILLPETKQKLMLRFDYQGNAYTAYWNDSEIVQNGVPGTTEESERALWLPQYADVPPGREATLVIPISNHVHRQGGLWLPIQIGTAPQIQAIRDKAFFIDTFLAGSLLIMGLYHLGLFVFRRKDSPSLWFGLFCILITGRQLVTGEMLLAQALPGLSWQVFMKFNYACLFAPAIVFTLFVHDLFPRFFFRAAKVGTIAAGLTGIAGVLVLPPLIFTHGITANYILNVGAGCVIGIALLRAAHNRQPNARLILLGFIVFFAAVVNDIVYNQFAVGPGFLIPWGLFCFVFLQAAALSRRIAVAFNTSEELAEHLADKVTEVQSAHAEALHLRGKLLEHEKMATVGNMAAGIVHDLKNPVALIKGYAEMADDTDVGAENRARYLTQIVAAADRMIDLVQDILDYSQQSTSVTKQSVDAGVYMDRVRDVITPILEQKQQELTTELDFDGTVDLDPDRFLRALVNIASNAADAMDGQGLLSIRLFRNNGRVVFYLSDNGPGIPEPIRANLFDP